MTKMRKLHGMWFPQKDTHFGYHLDNNPLVKGKGTYQFRKYKAALDLLPHEWRGHAVDVGSHIGLWARLMAHNFGKVTAFEPIPDHIACWKRNMAEFDNVTLHQCALGTGPDKMELVSPQDHTGHTHALGVTETIDIVNDVVTQVEVQPLDAFGLTDIDFLKIDVEGFELPVIMGGEETIRTERPMIVIEQKPNGDAERYGRKRLQALEQLEVWGATRHWEVGGDFCLTWNR